MCTIMHLNFIDFSFFFLQQIFAAFFIGSNLTNIRFSSFTFIIEHKLIWFSSITCVRRILSCEILWIEMVCFLLGQILLVLEHFL